MRIHVQRGEEELGVFSPEETTQYLAEGRLLETDWAWHEGMEDKVPVAELVETLREEDAPTFDEECTIDPGLRKAEAKAKEGEPHSVFGGGRYKREKLIGRGGMGQVWLAFDKQLERQVAVKVVSKKYVANQKALNALKAEVQKSLELTHSNIVRIHDLNETPGEDPFISMEYIEGEELSERREKQPEGRFKWREIEPYILKLCEALDHAHGQAMVHRDIKPQNVMLTPEDELKLADFGVAAPVREGEEDFTGGESRSGTPIYWSPQQGKGMAPAMTDDIYSLGVMIYELLVGEPPFKGPNEPAITRQHIQKPPPDPQAKLKELGGQTKIPGYVRNLILKCLSKNPAQRPQTMGEVQAWIKANGDPVVRRQKRMVLMSGVLGVVALAMGGLAIWAWNQQTDTEEQRAIAEAKQQEAETARKGEAEERKKAGMAQAINYYNIGDIHRTKGEYDKALEYYGKSLDYWVKQLGPEHLDVAACYASIGYIHLSKGEHDKALEHDQKSLAILLKKLGPEHPDVVASYNNIGTVYKKKGEYDKALEYFQKALAIDLKELGPNHPRVAHMYNNIACCLDALGKVKEAHDHMEKTLKIRQKAFGDGRQDTIDAKNALETLTRGGSIMVDELLRLGSVELGKAQHERALDFFRRALKLAEVRLGPNHIQVANSYNNIGRAHKNRGGHQNAALEPYQKALAIWRTQLKPNLRIVAGIHLDIGMVYHARTEFDKALEYYGKSLDYWVKELGPNHPHVAFIYNRIGLTYRIKGDYYHARENYMKALPIQIRDLGPNHQYTKDTKTNLDLIARETKSTPTPPVPPKK